MVQESVDFAKSGKDVHMMFPVTTKVYVTAYGFLVIRMVPLSTGRAQFAEDDGDSRHCGEPADRVRARFVNWLI
jgi:hypothetical protein